jgi:hypothetical protein
MGQRCFYLCRSENHSIYVVIMHYLSHRPATVAEGLQYVLSDETPQCSSHYDLSWIYANRYCSKCRHSALQLLYQIRGLENWKYFGCKCGTLFNDNPSVTKAIWRRIIWKNDQVSWTWKDWWESGRCIFQGTVPEFSWKSRAKPE